MYVCMYVCMYVYLSLYIYIYIHRYLYLVVLGNYQVRCWKLLSGKLRYLFGGGGGARRQMYPLLFGVFGLRALGCLGFYSFTEW